MAKQQESRANELSALIVKQWLPQWDKVIWNPKQRQAEPSRKHFYLFSLPATLLRRLSGIQRRSTQDAVPRAEDTGIQRFHDQERSKEIGEYVRFGYPWSDLSEKKRSAIEFADLQKPGWLPTAIIVNIASAGTKRRKLELSQDDTIRVDDADDGRRATLKLPEAALRPAWQPKGLPPIEIIDGQHRLWAFTNDDSSEFELPVVAFVDLDISWQAYLFWTINIKPKRINASLAFDLYPLLRSEEWLDKFSGHPIYRETRAQELVEALWSHPNSPWYQRINMLGESREQMNDPRSMVSQSSWIRSLMATYVKSWGRGSRVLGGLFGGTADSDDGALAWTRTQQAAFLIYAWQQIEHTIGESQSSWARAIRNVDADSSSGGRNPAFYSKFSLFTTDPGVRAFLAVTNDLCYLRREELALADWIAPESASAVDQEGVNAALASLRRQNVATDLKDVAARLASYDWRTSTAPGLSAEQQRSKRALRGSGGYRELRRDLLAHLASGKGALATAAQEVSAQARGAKES